MLSEYIVLLEMPEHIQVINKHLLTFLKPENILTWYSTFNLDSQGLIDKMIT